MDTLPVELHSQIFQLACIDDGGAARSLSLVSRYLHQVAEPFLFQTLIVSGHDRLDIVANKLEKSSIHCRRVRHLFLTDQKPHQNDSLPDPSGTICHEDQDVEKSPIIRILDLTSQSLISAARIADAYDPIVNQQQLAAPADIQRLNTRTPTGWFRRRTTCSPNEKSNFRHLWYLGTVGLKHII